VLFYQPIEDGIEIIRVLHVFQALQGADDFFAAGFAADDQADGGLFMLILIVAAPIADVLNHKAVLKTDHSEDLILQVKDNDVPAGYGVKREIYDTQPIIRYELEDITGYANQSCECGIPLPTLLPVQGRSSDFIYFRNSQGGYEKFHPYHILVPLFYLNDMRQYQLVQTERNELTF